MTSIQPQLTNLLSQQPDANGVRRWWMTLQCTASDLWQNLSDRNTGKIYKNAFHKTWELLSQALTLLLLLLLSVVGILIGAWLVGFHTGRETRKWLEADNPTPRVIAAKFVSLLLLPLQLITIWLDRALKAAFGWDLKLAQMLPPVDPELMPKELAADSSKKSGK